MRGEKKEEIPKQFVLLLMEDDPQEQRRRRRLIVEFLFILNSDTKFYYKPLTALTTKNPRLNIYNYKNL